jgi:nitronate monooxygenase
MGVAVSDWRLARAVSMEGQMGVVSGTGIDTVLARRLQAGDPGGHMRRAMAHFPVPEIQERVLKTYFVEGGKAAGKPFKSKPMPSITPPMALLELTVVANFVEVWLAKEGHDGLVGVNLLEKIQIQTLPSILGAMLAEVDVVLMGAGIPRAIPAVLDSYSRMEVTKLLMYVAGAEAGDEFYASVDPVPFCAPGTKSLKRPEFLAIVSSSALAATLARKATGKVNGFVIEGSTAGGHNAPPRGPLNLDEMGEPVYGPRDTPDLADFRELGLPFWLAGSYGSQGRLQEAISEGAVGIQVGTAFAFCEESGIDPELKRKVLAESRARNVNVFTDPKASPTGFPFKVVGLEGTLSESGEYLARTRICDLGYLRTPYKMENGKIGYRCGAEPHEDFLAKGGNPEDLANRKCVCNGLLATIGLGQTRKDGRTEIPLVTAGNEVSRVAEFLAPGKDSYTAKDVIAHLLSSCTAGVGSP